MVRIQLTRLQVMSNPTLLSVRYSRLGIWRDMLPTYRIMEPGMEWGHAEGRIIL